MGTFSAVVKILILRKEGLFDEVVDGTLIFGGQVSVILSLRLGSLLILVLFFILVLILILILFLVGIDAHTSRGD